LVPPEVSIFLLFWVKLGFCMRNAILLGILMGEMSCFLEMFIRDFRNTDFGFLWLTQFWGKMEFLEYLSAFIHKGYKIRL